MVTVTCFLKQRSTEKERDQLKKAAKNAGNIMAFVQKPLAKHNDMNEGDWAWVKGAFWVLASIVMSIADWLAGDGNDFSFAAGV